MSQTVPGRDLLILGLMSLSVNTGSSTDTGLCRSGFSLDLSRSGTRLMIEELGAEVNGDDGNWPSSNDS